MADLSKIYNQVDSLLQQLNEWKPFKKEDEERLWKKFRLEWNYNSNHIEGNTLTYGQTELLLIFDKTTGDHEMREYEEMKAHDVAIKLIQEYAKDSSRDLTEADVRELNKVILVRPYWGNAQTPDGQPTKKEIIPGEYKKQPNSVRLQNGEMFHYTSPEETPAKMAELMAWYRKAETEKELHPLYLAARIHYDFVRIHPFDDCNGRTSRLLMNYVLLRHGFPPVIIKSADKKNYLNALNKADVGDFEAFVEYVGGQLVWSMNTAIKAAGGESIEEVDDIDKEISIWKRPRIKVVGVLKSPNEVIGLFERGLNQLFTEHASRVNNYFGGLVTKSTLEILFSFNGSRIRRKEITSDELMNFIIGDYLIEFQKASETYKGVELLNFAESKDVFIVINQLDGFQLKNGELNKLFWKLEVQFDKLDYAINGSSPNIAITKNYEENILESERQKIISQSIRDLFESVKLLDLQD